MSEDYRIVEVRESLPAGGVGVRVRVRLSGCPSRRWSRGVCARLASELVGHAAIGQLRHNEILQGDQILIEGVEEREAPALAYALQRAVDATNQALAGEQSSTVKAAQKEGDAIADQIAPDPRSVLTSTSSLANTGDMATPSRWFG